MNSTDSTLDRRAKSFALLRPLYDLDANKGHYSELQVDRLDLFRIASLVLETIITEMGGSRQGASRHQIGVAVVGEIQKSSPEIPSATRDRITEFVLDHLTNEKARDSFRIPYQRATEDGKVEWATAVFKLVELREIEAGAEPRYLASVEAINLFLQSLSIEIEAQQAASEAVMKLFLKHVHEDLLPKLKGLEKQPGAKARQKVISEIMAGVDRSRIDSEKNFLDVLDKVHEISSVTVDDTRVFTLSQVYEGLLLKMGEKGNDGGQFFTQWCAWWTRKSGRRSMIPVAAPAAFWLKPTNTCATRPGTESPARNWKR